MTQVLPQDVGDHFSDKPASRKIVLAGLFVIAALYLLGVTGRFWPSQDAAHYLGVGRSLAQGNGYKFQGVPDSSVGPGLPIVLAGFIKAFGESYWGPNILEALCGLATVAVVYFTIKRQRGRFIAACAAWATASSYVFYFLSHLILTDVPFMLLWWGSLWFALKADVTWRGAILAALLAAAAIFMRLPGIVLVLLTMLGLALTPSSRPLMTRIALPAAILLAPLAIVAALLAVVPVGAGQPLYLRLLQNHVQLPAWRQWQDIFPGLLNLPNVISELLIGQRQSIFLVLGVLIGLVAVIGVISSLGRRQPMGLLLVMVYPLILIVMGGERAARPRYLLPVLPWIIVMFIDGLAVLAGRLRKGDATQMMWRTAAVVLRFKRLLRRLRRGTVLPWVIVMFIDGLAVLARRLRKGDAAQRLWQTAAVVLLVFTTLINVPKIARHAVYYRYFSHSDRYYKVIEHGRLEETLQLAQAARQCSKDGSALAYSGDAPWLVCYLADRRPVSLPDTSKRFSSQAKTIVGAVADRQPDIVVVDIAVAKEPFMRTLTGRMAGMKNMKLFHRGERYLGYQRTRLASRPATTSKPATMAGENHEQNQSR